MGEGDAIEQKPKAEQQKLFVQQPKPKEQREMVVIKSLTVGQALQRGVFLGNSDSLIRMVAQERDRITAVYWSEEGIAIETDDPSKFIMFAPEFDIATGMFFIREEKRNRNMFSEECGMRIWEGEFEPIEIKKKDLLAYLERYANDFDETVTKAVKSMKITRKHEISEDMLNLDESSTKTVEETSETTNIPKRFTATLPIFDNIKAKMIFELAVAEKEKYGEKTTRVLHLRCVNSREILRDTMEGILAKLPEDIPKYYGKYQMLKGRNY